MDPALDISSAGVQRRWEELTASGALYEMKPDPRSGGRTWVNGPQTLREIVEAAAAHADRPFIVLDDATMTFADHHRAVCSMGHHLIELGVRPGDRVGIVMRNLPQFSVALFAAVSIGAIAMPLNAWWTSGELAMVLDEACPRVVVADRVRAERVSAASTGVDFALVHVEDESPDSWFDWAAAAICSDGRLPPVEVAPDDSATLFFTSGTSGRPRGVLGSHRNMTDSLLGRAFFRDLDHDGPPIGLAVPVPSRALLTVPLFHVTGSHAYLLGALATGSMVVLMQKWDAPEALGLIARHSISVVGGVPHVAAQLLDEVERVGATLPSLRGLNVGGAPCPPSVVHRAAQLLPDVQFGNGYGMTETSSVAIYNFGSLTRRHADAAGWLNPIMDAVVVGPDGQQSPSGAGELWLRGGNVALGYWTGDRGTLERLGPDSWLATGDLATIHPDGLIELTGRSKDVIVRGGENIQPVEIESVLAEHAAITEAAVVGAPHPTLGEEVHAIVVRRHGTELDPADLMGFLRQRLAAFKVPAAVWVQSGALPRSPQGKVQRAALSSSPQDRQQIWPAIR